MTILAPHTASRVRNAALSALHFIAYEHQCEVPDILALITPSQPSSQAPAARVSEPATPDTQAEVSAPQASADHSPETAHEIDRDVQRGNADPAVAAENARKAIPDVGDGCVNDAGAGESPAAGDQTGKSGEAPASPAPVKRTRTKGRGKVVEASIRGNPDWTDLMHAEHLGVDPAYIRRTAVRLGLKLASRLSHRKAKQAATTEALKAAPAKPQKPVGRAGPPTPRSEAPPPPVATATKRVTLADQIRAHLVDHPDATARDIADATGKTIQSIGWAAQRAGIVLRKYTAEERSAASARGAKAKAKSAETAPQTPPRPPVEADASDVLHRVKKAPSGRFYLRDKTTLEFVHQSLAPSPNGSGPMMTKDRKWAWYDTMQRYRGAKKRWPELADMRKEAVAK